jgi:hypothetical protein
MTGLSASDMFGSAALHLMMFEREMREIASLNQSYTLDLIPPRNENRCSHLLIPFCLMNSYYMILQGIHPGFICIYF